jgi:hypothetical protein
MSSVAGAERSSSSRHEATKSQGAAPGARPHVTIGLKLERRVHLARLTSSVGAAVTGVGLGVVLSRFLDELGLVILLLGALIHAWGMFDGMRVEKKAELSRPGWSTALYWLCWCLLAALLVYVVAIALW